LEYPKIVDIKQLAVLLASVPNRGLSTSFDVLLLCRQILNILHNESLSDFNLTLQELKEYQSEDKYFGNGLLKAMFVVIENKEDDKRYNELSIKMTPLLAYALQEERSAGEKTVLNF